MKSLSKFAALATVVTTMALAAFNLSPALADSPGQIVGSPNAYVVKDITTSGNYAASVSPACGDVIQYSAELHNPMNGGLTNIMVSANLGNGSFSAVPAEGASQGMSASVSVNLPSGGSLAYQGGTTTLYDGSGNVIRTLSDGITSGGVNIGDLPGSTTEFVNFKAKVSCPSPTPTPATTVSTPVKPVATALPNTGAGDVLGLFGGASALGGAGHYFASRRRK